MSREISIFSQGVLKSFLVKKFETVRVVGFLSKISCEKEGPEITENFSRPSKTLSSRKPFEAFMKGFDFRFSGKDFRVFFKVFEGAEKIITSEVSQALNKEISGNL